MEYCFQFIYEYKTSLSLLYRAGAKEILYRKYKSNFRMERIFLRDYKVLKGGTFSVMSVQLKNVLFIGISLLQFHVITFLINISK